MTITYFYSGYQTLATVYRKQKVVPILLTENSFNPKKCPVISGSRGERHMYGTVLEECCSLHMENCVYRTVRNLETCAITILRGSVFEAHKISAYVANDGYACKNFVS